MSHKINPVEQIPLSSDNYFAHPPNLPELVHFDDPAIHVMTDLNQVKAVTIRPDASIKEAQLEMNACHIHMLFVVDRNERTVGLITSEDLLGEKPIQMARERKIHHDDLPVRSIMTPQEKMIAIKLDTVKQAKVGNIVDTLHATRRHHAIVIEVNTDTNQHILRGIFSLNQISKQLGFDITDDVGIARSLAELQQDIR